jgi:hypothetical protein
MKIINDDSVDWNAVRSVTKKVRLFFKYKNHTIIREGFILAISDDYISFLIQPIIDSYKKQYKFKFIKFELI